MKKGSGKGKDPVLDALKKASKGLLFPSEFASVHFDRESRRLVTVGRYETFVEV